jgi:hypothetical protein
MIELELWLGYDWEVARRARKAKAQIGRQKGGDITAASFHIRRRCDI